jgi:hypothetical protein
MVTRFSFTWGSIDEAAAAVPLGGGAYYTRRKRWIEALIVAFALLVH